MDVKNKQSTKVCKVMQASKFDSIDFIPQLFERIEYALKNIIHALIAKPPIKVK